MLFLGAFPPHNNYRTIIISNLHSTVSVRVAVTVLTLLLAIQLYSPADSAITGDIMYTDSVAVEMRAPFSNQLIAGGGLPLVTHNN